MGRGWLRQVVPVRAEEWQSARMRPGQSHFTRLRMKKQISVIFNVQPACLAVIVYGYGTMLQRRGNDRSLSRETLDSQIALMHRASPGAR